VPRGGDPFAESLASIIDKPDVFLPKDWQGNIGDIPEYFPKKELTILPVENVTTSAGSAIKTIKVFIRYGYRIKHLLTVIDRESGAEEALRALGVELVPVFKMSDLLDFYLKRRKVLQEPCDRAIQHATELRLRGLSG
jgi:orotate phosphoribosyltransferase